MSVSRRQLALLRLAKDKLRWSDTFYRETLARIAGVTSSTELDRAGFEAVMGFCEYCGFRPPGRGTLRYGNRPGRTTFARLELIRELWREVRGAR